MLQKLGDFKAIEMALKRWKLKMKRLIKSGGWYTKVYLEHEAKWTKPSAQPSYYCDT